MLLTESFGSFRLFKGSHHPHARPTKTKTLKSDSLEWIRLAQVYCMLTVLYPFTHTHTLSPLSGRIIGGLMRGRIHGLAERLTEGKEKQMCLYSQLGTLEKDPEMLLQSLIYKQC